MTHIQLTSKEKRYFPRVSYRAHGRLKTSAGEWPVHIINLSFNGSLLAVIYETPLNEGDRGSLVIDLDDGEQLKMNGQIVHRKGHYYGLKCHPGTPDHMAKLRAILERYRNQSGGHRKMEDLLHSMTQID